MNIAIHEVKRVIIEQSQQLHKSICREIILELEDGKQVTIEIFYNDENLKLEIN